MAPAQDLGTRIRARFAAMGDVQLTVEPRQPVRGAGLRRSASIGSRRQAQGTTRASMSTLLDTNVLSELLRAKPSPAVLAWFAAQPPESLFVSAVNQAEMMLGARLLPAGKRRTAFESALLAMYDEDFAGRILPFDAGCVPAVRRDRQRATHPRASDLAVRCADRGNRPPSRCEARHP